ncbi:MAG: hypothetical protein QXE79_07435 [Candidatus Bathyarchaeia archaeon]
MYQATKYAPTPKTNIPSTSTPASTEAPTSAHTPGKGPVTLIVASPEWLPGSLTGENLIHPVEAGGAHEGGQDQ